jgi:hypothetical protein
VVAIAVVVSRCRATQRESRLERLVQPQVMAMVANPLHQSSVGTAVPSVDYVELPRVDDRGAKIAGLDDEMYVAQPALNAAREYAVFRSDRMENPPLYHVFKDIQPTSDDGDNTA